MPTSRVKLGDTGEIVTVEHPAGASPEEIKRLARVPRVHGYEVVKPDDPRVLKISPSQYLAERMKERAGDIAAMVGATVAPGKGALGLALRLAGAEVGQEVGDIATGQKVTPGYGAATQLVGEGVAKTVAPLLSPATYRAFANRTVRALGDTLKGLVPSWGAFPSSSKGVYDMAHGTGQRVLSQQFETAMVGIKRAIPETLVVQVPEMIETMGRLEQITKPRNARALIDELPALRKAGGKPYYNALRALANELPEGLAPELDAARREYRFGAGWIEFAEKGKFLYGERYDPANAQAALDRFGKRLLGRGMDEIAAIIRGPGAKPIEVTKISPWGKRLYGAAAGEIAGMPFGIPGRIAGPVLGGAAGERFLPSETYRNVPVGRAARWAERFVRAATGEGVREAARDLGIKEQMPGFTLARPVTTP